MVRKKILLIGLAFILIHGRGFSQFECKKEQAVEVKESWNDESWETFHAKTVDCISDFKPGKDEVKKTILGSRSDKRVAATGYFRTERINGRWWFVDPDGYLFYNVGIVEVGPGNSKNQQEIFSRKFESPAAWAEQTVDFLKSYGFNGAGAWSDEELLREVEEPFAYTLYYNFMKPYLDQYKVKHNIKAFADAGWQGYSHDLVFVFHPAFEEFVKQRAKGLSKYKNDKYMLGIFSDNEMPIVPDALDRHLKLLDHDDPGYIAAWSWLRGRKGPDVKIEDITGKDRDDFIEFYMDRYFSVVSRAIKENDPNHLYLGCRYNQEEEELKSPGAFRSAGKYCDVISVNHYRKWEPDPELIEQWGEWSGIPFIITEWYVKGDDTGMKNESGAGWIVKTQKDRGLFYQNFTLSLLQSPYCIGWHWFKYQDNDPSDETTDISNRNSNKGIVDIAFEPYRDLLNEMKMVNMNVYELIDFIENNR